MSITTTTTGAPISWMDILTNAIAMQADPATIAKLLEMHERDVAKKALQEFNTSMSVVKAKIGPIFRNREATGANGRGYAYADMAEISRTVDPILAEFGLSYRFVSSQNGKDITVTCIVSHALGHFEGATLSGTAEQIDGLSPMQSIGYAVTFLQRYTLNLAFGLASSEDNDCRRARSAGNGAPTTTGTSGKITAEQAVEIEELCADVGVDVVRLLKFMKAETIADIPATQFTKAITSIESKRGA